MSVLFTPGYLSVLEGWTLYRYAKSTPFPIVEIGSWVGRSTLFLACGTHDGYGQKVYAIDTWMGSDEHKEIPELVTIEEKFDHNVANCGFKTNIVKVKGHSQEIDLSNIPKKIGFLFIDGSHDYNSVRADFLRFSPCMAYNGAIAFHDVADYAPGVQQFVDHEIPADEWTRELQAHSMVVFRRSEA
jgi:predicted O-methyltransferase YrrM